MRYKCEYCRTNKICNVGKEVLKKVGKNMHIENEHYKRGFEAGIEFSCNIMKETFDRRIKELLEK